MLYRSQEVNNEITITQGTVMNTNRINIGIDMAKDKFDACFLNTTFKDSFYKEYPNSVKGFNLLIADIALLYPELIPHFGIESTSMYMKKLEKYLTDNDLPYILYNPRVISHYGKVVKIQGKTDTKDFFVISHITATKNETEFISSYNIDYEDLRQRTTTIMMITKIETQLKNLEKTLDELEDGTLKEQVLALIRSVRVSKEKLQKQSTKKMQSLYPVSEIIINKIKGIGTGTLLHLLPKIYHQVEYFTNNQITAFIGLNPTQYQSGKMRYKDKMNMFGSKEIKKMLFMCSQVAVRFNPIIKTFYEGLLKKGKPKKLAILASSRKLLVAIIGMIRSYKLQLKETY